MIINKKQEKEEFPHSSVGKESACNAGDLSLIPGSGRSPGEGIGYPLQYSWASLVAQLVKNPPAMRETWVRFLGREDPLEKGKATLSRVLQYSGLENSIDCIVHVVAESDTTERLPLSLFSYKTKAKLMNIYKVYLCESFSVSLLVVSGSLRPHGL